MIEKMGYNFHNQRSLNLGKGRHALICSFVPERKAPNYYHMTRRGLGYVTTPLTTDGKPEECAFHVHSSGTSSWKLGVSVGIIIKNLSVNMTSIDHLKKEDLISLIREYIYVFVWNYEDMPSLDPNISMHHLNIDPEAKSVKQ